MGGLPAASLPTEIESDLRHALTQLEKAGALSNEEQIEFLKPILLRLAQILVDYQVSPEAVSGLKIRSLDTKALGREYCLIFFKDSSEEFEHCVEESVIEAFYEPPFNRITLKSPIELNTPFGLGTLLHELVHFVEDASNRVKMGSCESQIRAFKAEQLLLPLFPEDISLVKWLDKQIQIELDRCTGSFDWTGLPSDLVSP